jgi:murein L,D-transpeptidase YcbB/YkuD
MIVLALSAVLVGVLGEAGSLFAQTPDKAYVLQDVRALLGRKTGLPLDVRSKADQLERYYVKPEARLLWLEPARADELITVLSASTSSGLVNMGGGVSRLVTRKQALQSQDASLLALVELTFSAQLIVAAENLRLGQIYLYRDMLHRRSLERFIYADHVLAMVAEGEPLSTILPRLEPKQADYEAIRSKLVEYVSIHKRGGWPALRPGPDLKEGSSGPRVTDLRQRLQITGHLSSSVAPADTFDATLAEAVRRFQRQHNLGESGIVDRRTLIALNIPVTDRIAQLKANLERWRWFEDYMEGELWVINVNTGKLDLRQANARPEQFSIKADRGCQQHPAFDSTITSVELAPSFSFAGSLSARYILPALQKKPGSLDPSLAIRAEGGAAATEGVDWKSYSEANFPFFVEQAPGNSNLLGMFRIVLKDDSAVSIHGRPAQEPKIPIPRDLWPSCVAISGPAEKTAALLQRLGIMPPSPSSGTSGSQRLTAPRLISVVFLYSTVWLDTGGTVVFGPDPLGLDACLLRKLSSNASS